MQRRRHALIVCAVFSALLATPLASFARGSDGNTWAGTWQTSYGPMKLDQSGSGTYDCGQGTIAGSASGDKLTGTWSQKTSCGATPEFTGRLEFTLDPENPRHFRGRWSYATVNGGAWSTVPWNGDCVEGPCTKNGATAATESAYEVTYTFSHSNDDDKWSLEGYGILAGPRLHDLAPTAVPRDALDNELRLVEGGRTRIVMEVETASLSPGPYLYLAVKVSRSVYRSCKKGASLAVVIDSARSTGDYVEAMLAPQCILLEKLFLSGLELLSGDYVATVRRGQRTFESRWTLKVAKGGTISGTSRWDCCPGKRLDPLWGKSTRDRIVVVRDCSDPCEQVYTIRSESAKNRLVGTWTQSGSGDDFPNAFALVCISGDCLRNAGRAGPASGKSSATISIREPKR